MVSAYSAFASGKRVKPVLYEKILGREGRIIEETAATAPSGSGLSEKTVEEMGFFSGLLLKRGLHRARRN